ncbi:MAG: 50S ribosomal protein L25 [Verrucomicrobiales bacterium]
MKSVSLTAYPRTLNKRIGSKKVRANDRVPAVIYGGKDAPRNLEIANKDFENLLHHSVSENILVDLDVTGADTGKAKHLALVQEIQHHALSGKIIHVDFREVSENEKVTVTVPVETVGESVGVKTNGGVLEHVLFKLKVRALPKNLPAVLTLDVSNLEVGQSIHIGDIQPPEGVEILGNKDISVISVAAPLTEAAETAAADAAATPGQPEMIKEKKDDAKAGGDKKAGDKKAADKKK